MAQVERLVSESRRMPGAVGSLPARVWWPGLLLATWNTGSRITALLEARVEDLSLADRWLVLRAEHHKRACDQLFSLSDQTVAALAPLYLARPGGGSLFAWPHSPGWLWKQMRRLVLASGIPCDTRGRQ